MFLVNKVPDLLQIVNLDTQSTLKVANSRIRIEPLNINIAAGESDELNDRVCDIVAALKANVRVYDLRDAIGAWKTSKAKSTETAAQTKARKAKGPAMRGGPAAETK